MTDWNSPEVIANNGVSFSMLLHVLFGLYIWEWVIFLDADWRYVKNIKRDPLSPMMLCFLNRYCLLAALICVVTALNVTSEINCQPLYIFMNLLGNIALELASIGFTARIVALWGQGRKVPHLARASFFVACLSVQAWLLLDAPIKAAWIPDLGCVITDANNSFPNIGRTFNAGYFLVLLAFASWDYARTFNAVVLPINVSLKELCWLGVAFLASCTNVVFIWICLNPVMAIITTIPTTIVISIASGHVFRLWNYSVQVPILPETTETKSQSPHTRSRFSFRTWELALGRHTHEAMEDSNFQRLDSAPASQTGSYLGTDDSMRAANSTRPSSIILPSLISPSSTYSPNRASQGPSTHLDSASESSDRGDRYDLDAQLGAAQRRSL